MFGEIRRMSLTSQTLFIALPVSIIRNTVLINRRLSLCEQLKTVLKLCRYVFSRGQVSRNQVNS